jgi:hypothetical protein
LPGQDGKFQYKHSILARWDDFVINMPSDHAYIPLVQTTFQFLFSIEWLHYGNVFFHINWPSCLHNFPARQDENVPSCLDRFM